MSVAREAVEAASMPAEARWIEAADAAIAQAEASELDETGEKDLALARAMVSAMRIEAAVRSAVEAKGFDVETEHSGLSEARYLEISTGPESDDPRTVEVRIAAHDRRYASGMPAERIDIATKADPAEAASKVLAAVIRIFSR